MTLDFLNRKRKRRLPFSDPMEGILEEIEETEFAKIKPEDVSKYYDVFAATEEQLKQIEPPPEPDLDELLGNVFPNLRGTTGISTIKAMAEQDTEGFLAEIKRRGRTPDTEAVLRQYNVEPEEIFGLEQKPPELEIETLIKQIWPETNVQNFAKFVQETPDQFIEAMRAGGWTKAKQDLLQAFGLDESEMLEVFGLMPPPVTLTKPNWMDADYWQQNLIQPYAGKDLKGKAAASFIAGIGDVISTTGGAARWLGYDAPANVLSTIGSSLQRAAPPDTLGEFEMADLLNPEFYATKITRTVPFSLSLLPLAIGGYTSGAALATTVGLGRIGAMIVGGLAGAALSRPLESAMEAGNTYDDAIARGKTPQEAKTEADEVFKKNMTLAGADAFQIVIALAPTPKWVPSSLVKAGLVRTAQVAGKMVIVGLSEGGEEVYQDMIQRHARGDEWQLDPVSKEVFAIGAVMGVGMGLGGDVMSGVVNRAKDQMSSALKKTFDKSVADFKTQGFTDGQAQAKALDAIAQTPEGQGLVADVIRQMGGVVPETAKAIRGIEARLGKPAEILKTLPKLADNTALQTAKEQGLRIGLDVEAVQGIAPDEYFVTVTTSKKAKTEFTDWLVELRNKNPENANAVESSLVGKFKFRETEPGYGRGRFLPFRTLEDAQKFLATGDINLVAKEISLKGEPMSPRQQAKAREYLESQKPKDEALRKLTEQIEAKETQSRDLKYGTPEYAELQKEIIELRTKTRDIVLGGKPVTPETAPVESVKPAEPTSLEVTELASLRRFKADLEKELTTATGPKVKELEGFLRTTEFSIRDLQEKMGRAAPEVTPIPPEVAYDASLEVFRKASREFTAIRNAYRAKEIGDAEYLRGKVAFDKASQEADAAEEAYIKAKAIPKAEAVTPTAPAPEIPEAVSVKGEAKLATGKSELAELDVKLSKKLSKFKSYEPKSAEFIQEQDRRNDAGDFGTWVVYKGKWYFENDLPESVINDIGRSNLLERTLTELPKPTVARPGVPEVAKAEVPPTKPPPTAVVPPKPPKPPVEQVAERISFDPDKQSLKEKFQSGKNKAIVHWIDKLYPVDKFVTQAKKTGVELGIEENPYLLARLLEGVTSKATNFIENGTFGRKFWKTEKGKIVPDYKGKGLSQILESVKEPQAWRDFSIYLTAVHAQELAKLDIKTGIEPDVATSAIKELESKYPNFSKLAGKLQQYQKQLLDYVQESGLISEDLRAKLDAKYYAYVPFYRVMDELQVGGYMGKKMADIASPIKRIKGSEREIINPLESIAKNTYAMINAADRNQVGVAMARIAHDVPDVAPMFQHIKTPIAKVATVTAKELGIEITGLSEVETEEVFNIFRPSMFKAENVATVMIEGKKQFFEVDPDLNKALHALDQGSMGILWKVLSAPAKWLRAGATLSPDFMIRNPARDALSAFVYSKYGFIPGLDFMKGVVSILRKDTSYRLYKMSGAEHSMLVSLDREYLQKSFKEVVEGKKFTDYVKHPLALLQIASELGEKATRLGEFKKGLAQGATPLEAGMASREVTLDFAKGGTQAIAVNRIIAFFNANIRGWDRMVTALKEKPVQTSTKIFLGITLPSILLYLVNRDDDRWKEIPQWQKDLFWIVMTKDTIYRIPKPFELGLLFGSGPERLLEWLDNKDPELFKNLWASIWEAGTPGWLPTGLAPIIENITNHSFFRGTPIVSEGKQALPPEFQYTQYSSEVAKGLGNLLKQSPAKIDNLVQGWTGGLGRYAMQGIDELLRGTGIVSPKIKPSPTAADIPALRAFVVRNPIGSASESVNKFYDVLEEYTAQEKRLKTLLEDGKKSEYETEKAKHPELFVFFDEKTNTVYSATARFLRQVSNELSDIRKLEDKVYKSADMTPEKKRELIDGLETIKTQLAQKALALIKNPGNESGILEVPIKELEDKLGKVLNPVSPISNEEAERYETPDLAKELGQVEGESKLSALLAKNNDILAEVALLPDSALYKIDRSVTRTGLTRRQNELLDQYDAAINKKAFIEEHPEIEVNPKTEWLKSNPESNAILALWGNAKILTQKAYDIVQDLIKNNDVPDNGLPEGAVPPKEVAKEYFAYNDAVWKFSANSWEAQLIIAKSDKLREFLKRDPIETPIASLELKVKNRKLFDKLDAFSDKESPDYILSDKAREEAIKKFKKDNPAFVDDTRRIEAIENKGEGKTVEAWVERGKVIDQFTAGSSEAKVWLLDNPDIHKWALEQELLTDDATDWNVPVLRLNVEYREQDKEYDALPTDGTARVDYLAKNEDYRKDRRRRDAYGLKSATGMPFPDTEIENYVDYYEIEGKGFRQERMLVENPTFAQAMHTVSGIDLPDPKKVPAVQYDEIYEANQKNFDRLAGLGDNKSPYYEEDPVKRERMRQLMRMDNGKLTDFGVAEIRRNAYGKFVPEKDIEPYVGYYSLIAEGKGEDYAEVNGTDLWYEDDWYLIDNIDFYKEVYVKLLGNERKDFRKVPTREVFQKYVNYIALTDKERDDYRRDNRDLDDWLVIKFGYKPIGEKKPAKPVVPKKKGKLGLSELDEILQREILTLK